MEEDTGYPLVLRRPNDTFFLLENSSPFYKQQPTGVVTAEKFLALVIAIAARLPDINHCINVCECRFTFIVTFCAIIYRGQTNVLPPNLSDETLDSLRTKHGAYVISDKGNANAVDVLIDASWVQALDEQVDFTDNLSLEIAGNHPAAICYTSGSTGAAKPILKTWETFFLSNRINSRAYLQGLPTPLNIMATVSSRHMWGLETTLLLPLHYDVTVTEGHPLFPADVRNKLESLPAPRLLVSTPTHLKALSQLQTRLPKIMRTLSATAPLNTEIAQQIEALTEGDVIEIYGCSEMGSMAWRRTVEASAWTLFDGFELSQDIETKNTTASAAHIPEPSVLGDIIECEDGGHFHIRGRNEDLVNIAGKRGSLAELNALLNTCTGVVDGVIFEPGDHAKTDRLCALVVLNDKGSKDAVIRFLRDHLDPVFIPRPIITVDAVPRNENGKTSITVLREIMRN